MRTDFVHSLFNLEGKTAVVTGGGGVLGSAICCALARAGAQVAILELREEKAIRIAAEITQACGEALPVHCDVLDKNSILAASEQVMQQFGKVDLLVNAAGGNKPQATTSADLPFFDLPADAF